MHDNILDNLSDYSAEQLVGYIRQDIITFDELKDEGLPKSTQDKIEKLLEESTEDADWQQACHANTKDAYQKYLSDYPRGKYRNDAWDKMHSLKDNTLSSTVSDPADETAWMQLNSQNLQELEDFVKNFPKSRHLREANKLINQIKASGDLSGKDHIKRVLKRGGTDIAENIANLMDTGKATSADLSCLITQDHNLIANTVLKEIRENGCITDDDLVNAGIDDIFIKKLRSDSGAEVSSLNNISSPTLKSIPNGYNEIYFWGVPRSGKTCALGSIMSTITSSIPNVSCIDSQGLDYMQQLASSFKDDNEVSILPNGTRVDDTHEMRYILTDSKGKNHGIAFIDLAGELFNCMGKREDQLNPDQKPAMKTLHDILVANRSSNPKMHFFVVEYGGETALFDGKTQDQLLSNCVSYLDANDIFKDNTIGVYLIITKADKAPDLDSIGEYVDKNYSGFQEGLKKLMKDNGICTRKGKPELKRFPFSVGDVCFRWWCKYDPEWTQYIIDEILERSYGKMTGWTGRLLTNLQG